ncbi:MAG: hypothetical protein ABW004_00225 [Aeromicrobium sp.]
MSTRVTVVGIGADGWAGLTDAARALIDGAFGAGNETTMSSADRESNGVRAGMTTQSTGTTVCDPDPGGIEIALIGLTTIPSFLIFCVLIFGTQRVIRYAQHHGLFSARLAARIERLGWVLLLGLVGAAVIEWLAGGLLLTRLLTDQSWTRGSFDLSITGIIGAYGLVSIGRVIRRAAILQDQVHDLTT